MSVRAVVRWVASAAFILMVAPIVGDFFSEMARENGVYDHPTERVERMLEAAKGIFGAQGFYWLLFATGGFAAGTWIDLLLKRADEPRPKSKKPRDSWESAYRKVKAMQRELEKLEADEIAFIPARLPYELLSLYVSLDKIGLATPRFNTRSTASDFFRANWGYLNCIAPFMRDGHRRAAKARATGMVRILNEAALRPRQSPQDIGSETQP